jgi:hypothetical protein
VLAYYGNNITGACHLLEVMTEFKVRLIVNHPTHSSLELKIFN